MPPIDRQFVRLPEGLVHLRRIDGEAGMPLVVLHASPGSSRGLEPLLAALAARDGCPLVLAPDTPGHGDSAALPLEKPEIADYAEALIRLLDAMGLDRVALYGAHTGARVACEVGVLFPDRVGPLLFDGIGEYSAEMQAEFLKHYAPERQPDDYGTQLVWAFNFVQRSAAAFPVLQARSRTSPHLASGPGRRCAARCDDRAAKGDPHLSPRLPRGFPLPHAGAAGAAAGPCQSARRRDRAAVVARPDARAG